MIFLHRKKSYSYEELLACGNGVTFSNDGSGRLPLPNMLMISRITHISATGGNHDKGYVEAELDITPRLWFFDCHFQEDPVMPGCLGLDAMWQLIGFFLSWSGGNGKGRALGVQNLKFSGQVLPNNKKVTYKIHILRVLKHKLWMGIADSSMEVDGKAIYRANALKVAMFNIMDNDF